MQRRDRERGAVATVAVPFVLLMALLLGLAINVGRIQRTRGDLQAAADSAALAAADSLLGGPTTATDARNAAEAFAARFQLTDGTHVGTSPSTIEVTYGFWHTVAEPCVFKNGSCPLGWEDGGDPMSSGFRPFVANAVTVKALYPLPTVMGGLFGFNTAPVSATATALSRRTRVSCSLPVGVSTCQLLDANGAFNCPFVDADGNHYMTLQFDSGVEVGHDNSRTLTRLNIVGPAADEPDKMRNFIRTRTYLNDEDCLAGQEYPIGLTTTAGIDNFGGGYTLLEPFMDGLIGIPNEETPPNSVNQTPTKCKLGQKRVMAVMDPNGWCTPWPGAPSVWPAGAAPAPQRVGRIVGYVNVVFTKVFCQDGFVFDQAKCESGMFNAEAMSCSNNSKVISGIEANVYCELPTGFPGDPTKTKQPRLVQRP